jgi:hypothetical protein
VRKFRIYERSGACLRVTLSAEGGIRGFVIFPAGNEDGGRGGVIFTQVLTDTGYYLIRVEESQWEKVGRGASSFASTMRDAKPMMKAMNMRSSFSNPEKMRRKPLSRRNSRSHAQIGEADVAALDRQTVLNQAVLRFGDFHPRNIS